MNQQLLNLLFLCSITIFLGCEAPVSDSKDPVSSVSQNVNWVSLIQDDLTGWTRLNGSAPYEIEDNAIVGTAVKDSPNSFLCTDQIYRDFILELEVWLSSGLNSGIQIRSNQKEDSGRVYGYQSELDPSDRKWTAGIYDESRRGWLYPLTKNPKGQEAFKVEAWNKIRIEAIGNTIRTWVNGIQCANLVDDLTSEGFIGLQVHSIGEDSLEGKTVKWRNIRICTEDLANIRLESDPNVPAFNYIPNYLTEKEKQEGWQLLWDGKTTNGWKGAKLDEFPANGWEMKDGILTVLESGGGESTNGGDIVTKKLYQDFELMVDFNITEGANSGIKYYVDAELNKEEGSAIGLEFQILDDVKHPDAKEGVNGNRTVGSLYDLIRADNLSEPSNKDKQFEGPGNWNRAHVISKDGNVEHWLNNVKVVEFNRHSQIFKALVEKSKYHVWPGFGQKKEGHILLQDHGNTVHFRSIKIKEL